MPVIVLYLATLGAFLVLDAVMLTLVLQPLFVEHLGPLLAQPFRAGPAAVFYLGYIAGLVYLVGWPALREGRPVLLPAAVIGAMAYGTFEFTGYAILAAWHWSMVAVDVTWGTVLTAVSAWAGVRVARAFGQGATGRGA
jgi:uncharacterized membrane protein